MAFCQNCGKELNEGAKFCEGCGQAVGSVQMSATSNNQKKQPTKPFFIGAILSIIISVICICISINYNLHPVAGTAISVLKEYGDMESVNQYYFVDNMMTILMWVGVILFALAITFLIIGFINNKKK